MKAMHKRAVEAPKYRREVMNKEQNQNALPPPNYKEGDLVMLNAKNIGTNGSSKNLSPQLYGPFKFIEAKGPHAFKLEISPTWRIDQIFHISLLEPY